MHATITLRPRLTGLVLGLAAITTAALAIGPDKSVRASPTDDFRTFEVTVTGDDDVPETGTAMATLTKTEGSKTYYSLTRTVTGPSSAYSTGTAVVDNGTHKIQVSFEKHAASTGRQSAAAGLSQVLGAVDAAESTGGTVDVGTPEGPDTPARGVEDGSQTTTVSLSPTQPDRYIFEGKWATAGYHFHESWRELTHLTAGIDIRSPSEGYEGDPGASVPFVVDVEKASRVEFLIDGVVVKTFHNAGRLTFRKKLYVPGFRRFTVNAYGSPTRKNSKGQLLGTADAVFSVGGLKLTPMDGAKIHGGAARTTAPPVGLTNLASVELRVDGKRVAKVTGAPWGVDLHFPSTGPRTITAIGFDSHGKQIAEAVSHVEILADGSTTTPSTPTTTPTTPTTTPPVDHGNTGLPTTPPPPPHASPLHGQPAIDQEPANPRNYSHSSTQKTMIVIHKAEGSLDATISWFKNSASRVSAHYTVDDTSIAQSLPDSAVAWHTGNHHYNQVAIGIENSGYTHRDDMSEQHYRRLAQLVAYLCRKHSIPMDRHHIIGHNEVPDPNHPGRFGGAGNHDDPGEYFDWNKFMGYVHDAAQGN